MGEPNQRELGTILDVKFDANGLVTAVSVDVDSHEVMMVAYMNQAALERTLATGTATYWSRSRQKFWVKGEESGHTQEVLSILVDCDQDCLLLKVRQKGVACHNGYKSCFYREIVPSLTGGQALNFVAKPEVDPKQIYRK